MIRRRRSGKRVDDRELTEAKRRTTASHYRATAEYLISTERLNDSRAVADTLALHNDVGPLREILESWLPLRPRTKP